MSQKSYHSIYIIKYNSNSPKLVQHLNKIESCHNETWESFPKGLMVQNCSKGTKPFQINHSYYHIIFTSVWIVLA